MLQQLRSLERWTQIGEKLDVFGSQKVLKVFQVGNEAHILKDLLGGDIIHVIRVCE